MTVDARDRDLDALATDDRVSVTVEEGLYVAEDEETGISSQGQSEEAALENLALALETYYDGAEEEEDDWL